MLSLNCSSSSYSDSNLLLQKVIIDNWDKSMDYGKRIKFYSGKSKSVDGLYNIPMDIGMARRGWCMWHPIAEKLSWFELHWGLLQTLLELKQRSFADSTMLSKGNLGTTSPNIWSRTIQHEKNAKVDIRTRKPETTRELNLSLDRYFTYPDKEESKLTKRLSVLLIWACLKRLQVLLNTSSSEQFNNTEWWIETSYYQ